jgi:TPP-dependent pyruvate/acetoin dehydrogenase alpha subunit
VVLEVQCIFFQKKYNFFGGHGIVGGQIPLGTGIAFGDKYFNRDSVTFNKAYYFNAIDYFYCLFLSL